MKKVIKFLVYVRIVIGVMRLHFITYKNSIMKLSADRTTVEFWDNDLMIITGSMPFNTMLKKYCFLTDKEIEMFNDGII